MVRSLLDSRKYGRVIGCMRAFAPHVPAQSSRHASTGHASAASRIQRQCAASQEQEKVTTKLQRAQAYSVVGRAVECMRREEPRRKIPVADGRETGRGGGGGQTTAGTPGARLLPVYVHRGWSPRVRTATRLPLLIACLNPFVLSVSHFCLKSFSNGLRRH